jgi:dTDP-4-dehydrorhamnose reductase
MTSPRGIAVIGSEGQLGSELVRQLGHTAIPFNRRAFDLGDACAMRAALLRAAPQAVINAAGFTQVDLAETNERQCIQVNADAVADLAKCCQELDCTLVQISTDYVFGAAAPFGRPFCESDAPSPQGVYARSKLAGERAAECCSKHIIVRTCGLYGPLARPSQRNFVETILRLAGQRDRLRVVNDQVCSPSYVRDVVRAIRFLITESHFGLFHVVNDGVATWYEFAREILQLSNIMRPIEPISTAEFGAAAPRPAYSVLSVQRFCSIGGDRLPHWRRALSDYLATRGKPVAFPTLDTFRAA